MKDLIFKQLFLYFNKVFIYELNKYDQPYIENPEAGPLNMAEKLKRLKNGDNFEWPNIVALNHAAASLITNEKHIVNIGAGTGILENHLTVDNSLKIVASEMDSDCLKWCKKNRKYKNVTYTNLSMSELIKKYGKFDLAFSIEVIEHINDYALFLRDFSKLSDKAVITTPNRMRDFNTLIKSPPVYYQHVREWTAGEFYWILKMFYKKVRLYSQTDPFIPYLEEVGINTAKSPIIAFCEK